jgi:tRNA (guanine37-N1)-methyltransferase
VLRSGDHGAVARWRRDQALDRTRRLRPDLLEQAEEGADGPQDPG